MRTSQPSRRRRTARWVQLTLAAGLLVAALLHAEAAAQTTDPQVEIVPLLECVARNDDGSLTAKLGWDNRSGRILRPLQGTENKIIPGRHQSVLPTEFATGKVTTKNGGFTVTFPEDGKITWLLFDQVLEASAASPPCPPDQRGAPTTTVQQRPATTAPKAGTGPASSSGPAKGAAKAARTTTTVPVVVAAGAGGGGGSLGAADVVPALLLGIGVLWMVAFGLESRRGRIAP